MEIPNHFILILISEREIKTYSRVTFGLKKKTIKINWRSNIPYDNCFMIHPRIFLGKTMAMSFCGFVRNGRVSIKICFIHKNVNRLHFESISAKKKLSWKEIVKNIWFISNAWKLSWNKEKKVESITFPCAQYPFKCEIHNHNIACNLRVKCAENNLIKKFRCWKVGKNYIVPSVIGINCNRCKP